MRKKLLLTLFCLSFFSAFAQKKLLQDKPHPNYFFGREEQVVYADVLKLKLSAAEKRLNGLGSAFHRNAAHIYLKNLLLFSEAMLSADPKKAKGVYLEAFKKQIKEVEKLPKNSPYHLWVLAEMNFRTAILHLRDNKRSEAVWRLRSALKALEKNTKAYPDFIQNKKLLGLFSVLFSVVPESYEWALWLMGLKGNENEGMKMLQEAASDVHFTAPEAQIYRSFLLSHLLERGEEGLSEIESLAVLNPDSKLSELLKALTLIKLRKASEAKEILDGLSVKPIFSSTIFTFFLKAEIAFSSGNYLNAKLYYSTFLKFYKGTNYRPTCLMKLYLCMLYRKQDGSSFLRELKNCSPDAPTQQDKLALRFAEKPENYNTELLKLRFMFDGGFFKQALSEAEKLNSKDFKDLRSSSEFLYRKGRLLQKTGNFKKAISHFKRASSEAGNETFYFIANGFYESARIFEKHLNDRKKAIEFYKKVLNYPAHKYKDSLDAKAALALERLGGR